MTTCTVKLRAHSFFAILAMEMATLMTSTLLLLLSLLVAAYILLRRSRCRPPLPPGPWGLPVVGYLPFLRRDLHIQFSELAKTYGPIISVRFGTKTCVLITSPDIASEIYRKKDHIFANRDPPAAALALTYGEQNLIWSPNGRLWRQLRRLTVHEMMNSSRLGNFALMRGLEIRKMLHNVMECAGSPVDLVQESFSTSLNSITAMLWGGTLEGEERRKFGSEFWEVIEDALDLVGSANFSDFFPLLAKLDLQGIVRKTKKKNEWINKTLQGLIEKRLRKNSDDRNSTNQEQDFLQVLLGLCGEEGDTKELSITNIKALLLELVIAATDTTSNTISWAMAELLNHPNIMEKAQKEIDKVVGKDKIVEESNLSNLHYIKAIIKEALRLHPIIPFLTPRRSSETCIVGGYTVPSNTQVLVNAWAIHRDPKLWDNPLEFKPERFLGENCKFRFSGTNQDLRYIPFGGGSRICVGIPMADILTTHILASFLHSFDWKLPEGEKLDMSAQFGIVLKKTTPLVAVPIPRLSLQL